MASKQPRIVPVDEKEPAGYPSLGEHLLSRRDMLTYLGASLVTATAAVGCEGGRPSGGAGGDAGLLTLRIPHTGELLASLTGGGSCQFFVLAALPDRDSYHALYYQAAEAESACVSSIGTFTLDGLETTTGRQDAEGSLLLALREITPAVLHATLTILVLAP